MNYKYCISENIKITHRIIINHLNHQTSSYAEDFRSVQMLTQGLSMTVNIELVHDCKPFAVHLSDRLSFGKNEVQILACCRKRFNQMKMLRSIVMPLDELSVIFCSVVVNHISYDLVAWGEYLIPEQTLFSQDEPSFADCNKDFYGMF
jgi:hypothetical protein